jgi:hypothetical protein
MQRAVLAAVARAPAHDLALALLDRDLGRQGTLEPALRALDRHVVLLDLHGHSARHGNGELSDSRHL